MSVRAWFAASVVVVGSVFSSSLIPATPAWPVSAAPATTSQSTLNDQTDLAVTVYNSDLALVRDVRQVTLPRGVFTLEFQDIAATVNPATVHFRSLTDAARVGVLEQNYQYDLLEPDKLLRKFVGRQVTLVRSRQGREEEVAATLLSYNQAPVWQIDGEVVTGLSADHIRFPELPGNLRSRPTLVWTLENGGVERHRIEAAYLASKLSWSADYVLTVGRDERSADVDGWVTVTNGSGTSFPHATLQLVAGELNRVRQAFDAAPRAMAGVAMARAEERMVEEGFADYHLYTVGRKTSVENNETKQVSLLGATNVGVAKRYVVNGQAHLYRNPTTPGAPIKDPVRMYYRFKNDQAAGLGLPMPAGIVRVYQADSRGHVQFVGEDRIGHTPKDESLNLHVGNAFDVVAERKQTDFLRIASNVYEVAHEVRVRNHKDTPITVEVNEPIGGSWRMLRASHDHTKTDAWAAEFQVPVAAGGEAVLTYRVRVTY